mmetsp:Transcript_3572/g.11606  ORF Transcript_3572/g.11606 Transcript_3572/m.11606 type:complete len:293 (+) Transcript_3572:1540-2418(+)
MHHLLPFRLGTVRRRPARHNGQDERKKLGNRLLGRTDGHTHPRLGRRGRLPSNRKGTPAPCRFQQYSQDHLCVLASRPTQQPHVHLPRVLVAHVIGHFTQHVSVARKEGTPHLVDKGKAVGSCSDCAPRRRLGRTQLLVECKERVEGRHGARVAVDDAGTGAVYRLGNEDAASPHAVLVRHRVQRVHHLLGHAAKGGPNLRRNLVEGTREVRLGQEGRQPRSRLVLYVGDASANRRSCPVQRVHQLEQAAAHLLLTNRTQHVENRREVDEHREQAFARVGAARASRRWHRRH